MLLPVVADEVVVLPLLSIGMFRGVDAPIRVTSMMIPYCFVMSNTRWNAPEPVALIQSFWPRLEA